MSRRLNRKASAPIGAGPASLDSNHISGHKKSKRNQSRLDQSSDVHAERPNPKVASSKHGGNDLSCSTPSDDDADGDVSNADAAEPDDESDEDGENDAFAPSDHAIKEHGDQAGRLSRSVFDCGLASDGKQSHNRSTVKTKPKVIKSSMTTGDSDDEIYNRVDLISDSEDDEPNLEQLEERNIIESEEADDVDFTPASLEPSDGWEGFELDKGLFLEDVPFFDEQYGRMESNTLDSELALFQSTSVIDQVPSPSPLPRPPSPRRVRFEEPLMPFSSDSDVDSNNGDINVLFRPAPSSFVPLAGNLDLSGPFLGYEDKREDESEDESDSSVGSSSGYETDYGDTTDEEDIPACATKRPMSLVRQPSLDLDTHVPATPTARRPNRLPGSPAGYRRGPRIGIWTVEYTKPCAAIDSTGENLIIRPATGPPKCTQTSGSIVNSITSTANASPITSQQGPATTPGNSANDSSSHSNQIPMYKYNDPVLGPGSEIEAVSASLMTGHSRQPSTEYSFSGPSVFLPMDAMRNVRSLYNDDDFNNNDDDDDDDDDALLNIDDFIDFGDGSSDDGDQAAADDSSPTSPVFAEGPGPVQLKTPSPDTTLASDDLMKNLDRHIVSAFRRGQPQPQSRPRPNNSGLNNYALKGVRPAAANAQTGPQKKRKMSGGVGHRPSFGMPAAKRRMIHHREQ